MKIAVTTEKDVICGHFGHAKNFTVFTVAGGEIISKYELNPEGNHCSSMPEFIKENDIDVVITAGMGQGAVDSLKEKGIKSFSGAEGNPEEAVQKYIDGRLGDAGANCIGHAFEHENEDGKVCKH
ncbi:NifB/NifX family molybdenum-iron cluster-binding protein [Peptostreptococcus equinus]|uniref:NifB/NifX family molybdenum-iron cluster-binding protein n=1 Tax=Peptostreptococcus equinus TaxID=3003601 RepID=A0ABY7JQT8_9FIRM|nr:NifB/NifX family molybdenum-iron cluster-binding protein [Peptostreptococcus sp. CBA3647]WAW14864.1 NifB/NifX family molybdenum-iron cluster-binding protein [Peptostreptococcus sp. CBA3647]